MDLADLQTSTLTLQVTVPDAIMETMNSVQAIWFPIINSKDAHAKNVIIFQQTSILQNSIISQQ